MNPNEQYDMLRDCMDCEGGYNIRCEYGHKNSVECPQYADILLNIARITEGYPERSEYSELERALKDHIEDNRKIHTGELGDIDYFG